MFTRDEIARFQNQLLTWFDHHRRDLPWRRTSDPYAIWVSEIMLQQTRVASVVSYYERFLTRFPDVETLAQASEPDLLSHWAGLGYYHRARNLQKAARLIRDTGCFPATRAALGNLPGVGDYTAAAVASISFNLPHAVLDGNVFRVLSRVLDDTTNISSGAAQKHFSALAHTLLDRTQPGTFNQAMMELGATICVPNRPLCLMCPVSDLCRARSKGRENELPVKRQRRETTQEQRQLFWIEYQGKLLVWQRPSTSRLMPGFWELPEGAQLPDIAGGQRLGSFTHTITCHKYLFEVMETSAPVSFAAIETSPPVSGTECQWISFKELDSRPVSTVLLKARRIVEEHRNPGNRSARGAVA